ncbi:LOW QUALITY PROTEIN: hypothetical protein SETIT_5G043500v2 [Setaria italica]|uniref:Uncharacterized protein n=1 Tax=Setaria italica TaxID=4555 RepID=A0A368R151_SETIT|nr:LOW QUALITY PROTEIN: hypothetical protein SETIT_5G043500v2 [Setaria italica]
MLGLNLQLDKCWQDQGGGLQVGEEADSLSWPVRVLLGVGIHCASAASSSGPARSEPGRHLAVDPGGTGWFWGGWDAGVGRRQAAGAGGVGLEGRSGLGLQVGDSCGGGKLVAAAGAEKIGGGGGRVAAAGFRVCGGGTMWDFGGDAERGGGDLGEVRARGGDFWESNECGRGFGSAPGGDLGERSTRGSRRSMGVAAGDRGRERREARVGLHTDVNGPW